VGASYMAVQCLAVALAGAAQSGVSFCWPEEELSDMKRTILVSFMLLSASLAHAETVDQYCGKKAMREVESDFHDAPPHERSNKLVSSFYKCCMYDHRWDNENAPNPTSDDPPSY
jgi:hypothetical protein